jgi:hypothetical protein
MADIGYCEYVEVAVERPGTAPEPPSAVSSFRLVVGGMLLSISIAVTGVYMLSSKSQRRPMFFAIGLLGAVVLLSIAVWRSHLVGDQEYVRWQQDQRDWEERHDAWKNGRTTITKKIYIPPEPRHRDEWDER